MADDGSKLGDAPHCVLSLNQVDELLSFQRTVLLKNALVERVIGEHEHGPDHERDASVPAIIIEALQALVREIWEAADGIAVVIHRAERLGGDR